jgi:hypothetical protein
MRRTWRQRIGWIGAMTAAAIVGLGLFSAGYELGHVQGWNDAKRVARGDAAFDALPPHGWFGWPSAFPDDDERMR